MDKINIWPWWKFLYYKFDLQLFDQIIIISIDLEDLFNFIPSKWQLFVFLYVVINQVIKFIFNLQSLLSFVKKIIDYFFVNIQLLYFVLDFNCWHCYFCFLRYSNKLLNTNFDKEFYAIIASHHEVVAWSRW